MVCLIDIVSNCLNKGNAIIQYATKCALLRDPRGLELVSAFSEPTEMSRRCLEEAKLVIIPGATALDAVEHPGVVEIPKGLDVAAVGVSIGSVDNDVLRKLNWLKHNNLSIGARDPATLEMLSSLGVPASLTGCPTLLLPRYVSAQTDASGVVVSLGRGDQGALLRAVRGLSRFGPVTLLRHVPKLQPTSVPNEEWKVSDLDDPLEAIKLYANAALVVTSRIHGLLPALAFEKPVIFLGGWHDARYSLLEYLGVSSCSLEAHEVLRSAETVLSNNSMSSICADRVGMLQNNMDHFLSELRTRYGEYLG